MRQVLLVTGGAVLAVSVIVGLFALNQANQEQLELTARLQSRSQILADSLAESIEPSYNTKATSTLQRVIDRFVSTERLAGLGVFDNAGLAIAVSEDIPLPDDVRFVTDVMDSDEPQGAFVRRGEETFYTYILPLHEDERVVGAFAVVQNATYIDESIAAIWRDNLIRLFSQTLLFALVIFVLIRFVFFRAISQLAESLQNARKTNDETGIAENISFLRPLTREISKVTKSLRQARHSASEEARMRLEKLDSPWTAERLREFVKAYLKGRPIYVITHREPYIHKKTKGRIQLTTVASGAIAALQSVMEACGGTWLAYGSGDADRETADKDGKIAVPPDEPRYTLKRVWPKVKEAEGHYRFSVEAMYTLCLMTHTRPVFRADDWRDYQRVNATFAEAFLEEIKDVQDPIVLVQDYQFTLLPRMIKVARPDVQISLFMHSPWPHEELFSICPWRKKILDGMLGADVIGFNTQQHCNNFIDTVGAEIESQIDFERLAITKHGHTSLIKSFPISTAFTNGSGAPQLIPDDRRIIERLGIGVKYLAIGADRLDFTKGILERFNGVDRFLATHPEYLKRFTLLQIAAPNREIFEHYKKYGEAVTAEAERINKKYGTSNWQPIVLEKVQYTHEQLAKLYRLATVCLVTSLHDSMNLVAKEFVAARNDEAGVLVLSRFAGASRDLRRALIVNPYSADEISDAIYKAITMPVEEQQQRMKSMRDSVKNYNVYRWAAELIKALADLD